MNYALSYIEPKKSWTGQEQWVWKKLCCGEEPNFNADPRFGGLLDVKQTNGLCEGREISPGFLLEIILNDPYRGALSSRGVHITGAWFKSGLDLSGKTLDQEIRMEGCRFDGAVDLSNMKSTQNVLFSNSYFKETFHAKQMAVKKNFYLRTSVFSGGISMVGATISGSLDLTLSRSEGNVQLDSATINGNCVIADAEFLSHTGMVGAKVGGDMDIAGSNLASLDVSNISIKGILRVGASSKILRNGAEKGNGKNGGAAPKSKEKDIGMPMGEIKEYAASLGINSVSKYRRREDLIHAIQLIEGHTDCFKRIRGCALSDCKWFKDCLTQIRR